MSAARHFATLGELTERTRPICYGVLKPGPYVEDGVPLIRIMDLEDGVVRQDLHRISPELDIEFRRSRVTGGEILISIQGTIGRVAVCPPELAGANISRTIALISPDDRVDRRYLFHWLSAKQGRFATSGSTRESLNISAIRQVQVPLPPLDEQRRIAAILDAAETLRAQRREALAKLDALVQSIFVDMFGDTAIPPVSPSGATDTHPDGWPRVRLTSIAELTTGHTPDRNVAEYWDGEISWINLNEIRDLDGKTCHGTLAHVTPEGVRHSSAVVHPAGTVCLSRTASVGFVTVMGVPMVTSQDFVNWICSDALNPIYLLHALVLSRRQLRAASTGSTHKTIYVRDAERFTVLLPPRGLQDEFVRRNKQVEDTRSAMTSEVSKLDDLFSSLQQRAFRGEL